MRLFCQVKDQVCRVILPYWEVGIDCRRPGGQEIASTPIDNTRPMSYHGFFIGTAMSSINMKIRPFQIPNFVSLEQPPGRRQDGMKAAITVPVGDLDPQTLSDLCDEFRAALFAKVQKPDPQLKGETR